MNILINRRGWFRGASAILLGALVFGGATGSQAKPIKKQPNAINVVPTVTSVSYNGKQLLARGSATAIINGQLVTSTFTAPVNIGLAPTAAPAAGCPVLDLSLGPINLDLLGLVVETSDICLDITAIPGGGLLGDLLCNLGTLLQQGIPLGDILNGASATAVSPGQLTQGLVQLLNGVLGQIFGQLVGVFDPATPCDILFLEVGPLDLTLLGLNVVLDNCNGGPVTVDVRGEQGLLGQLLCGLLGPNGVFSGTLQNLIGAILGQL